MLSQVDDRIGGEAAAQPQVECDGAVRRRDLLVVVGRLGIEPETAPRLNGDDDVSEWQQRQAEGGALGKEEGVCSLFGGRCVGGPTAGIRPCPSGDQFGRLAPAGDDGLPEGLGQLAEPLAIGGERQLRPDRPLDWRPCWSAPPATGAPVRRRSLAGRRAGSRRRSTLPAAPPPRLAYRDRRRCRSRHRSTDSWRVRRRPAGSPPASAATSTSRPPARRRSGCGRAAAGGRRGWSASRHRKSPGP